MNETVFNSILIFVFIIVGGVFAAAEMVLVSLRGSQVKQLGRRGRRGRLVARLHDHPNRFLSAVPDRRDVGRLLVRRVRWHLYC